MPRSHCLGGHSASHACPWEQGNSRYLQGRARQAVTVHRMLALGSRVAHVICRAGQDRRAFNHSLPVHQIGNTATSLRTPKISLAHSTHICRNGRTCRYGIYRFTVDTVYWGDNGSQERRLIPYIGDFCQPYHFPEEPHTAWRLSIVSLVVYRRRCRGEDSPLASMHVHLIKCNLQAFLVNNHSVQPPPAMQTVNLSTDALQLQNLLT